MDQIILDALGCGGQEQYFQTLEDHGIDSFATPSPSPDANQEDTEVMDPDK